MFPKYEYFSAYVYYLCLRFESIGELHPDKKKRSKQVIAISLFLFRYDIFVCFCQSSCVSKIDNYKIDYI